MRLRLSCNCRNCSMVALSNWETIAGSTVPPADGWMENIPCASGMLMFALSVMTLQWKGETLARSGQVKTRCEILTSMQPLGFLRGKWQFPPVWHNATWPPFGHVVLLVSPVRCFDQHSSSEFAEFVAFGIWNDFLVAFDVIVRPSLKCWSKVCWPIGCDYGILLWPIGMAPWDEHFWKHLNGHCRL